jgi:hypothetical protein
LIDVEVAPGVHASLRRGAHLAEEVKNEIYDGARPYTTYVRGVIVDSALIIEG